MKKLLTILTMFVFVLSGCGATGTSADATKTVSTVKGDVEVPTDPKNVVVQGYTGDLLALGITPVAYEKPFYDSVYLDDKLKDSTELASPMNPEKVMEQNPDLIIVYEDSQYDQLSAIAPTVYIPYDHYNSIEEEITGLGEILSREDEAKDVIADFADFKEEKRKEIAGLIPEGKTVGIYALFDNDIIVYGQMYGRGGQVLYNVLDLPAPEKIQKDVFDKDDYIQVSEEKLDEYAADYMFISIPSTDTTSLKTLQSKEIYKSLDAVKNNHVYTIEDDKYYANDIISVKAQTEEIIKQLKDEQ